MSAMKRITSILGGLIITSLVGFLAAYSIVATPTAEARTPQGSSTRIFADLVERCEMDADILANLEECVALLEDECICGEID